ncbi:MAG: hypothetical protein JSR82_10695 [Verrucomicrobia bacterium]|nr:hypothetical protein [Verrucomicrobiota bacterium]
MPRIRLVLLLLLAACLPSRAQAGAQRQPEVAVRFLLAADPRDGATFVTTLTWQGRPVVVSRVPVASEREIVSMYPFTAADGSFGCALQLNDSGRLALQTITVAHRGGRMFVLVGGRVITPLALDRIVSDGIVTIPFGLTEADIRALGKSFRIMPEARR